MISNKNIIFIENHDFIFNKNIIFQLIIPFTQVCDAWLPLVDVPQRVEGGGTPRLRVVGAGATKVPVAAVDEREHALGPVNCFTITCSTETWERV